MKIGELAVLANTPVETIRFYEREALLPPAGRTAGNYRVYEAAHAERLAFIRHCRSLDMPLAEIKRLIDLSSNDKVSCDDVDQLVRSHLERVRAKRVALEALEAQLATLSAQCASGHRVADCGILGELIHAAHGEACACHPR